MAEKKNGKPVSALRVWLLIAVCVIAGLLLGCFIWKNARNDLDMAREAASGDKHFIQERIQVWPPSNNDVKERW